MRTLAKPLSLLSALLFRLPRLSRLPLALEVTLAVSIKLLLLAWLWQAFFSAPQAKKMRLPTAQVEQHLLADPQAVNTLPSHSALPEDTHDSHR
jgi:hypothetical protein